MLPNRREDKNAPAGSQDGFSGKMRHAALMAMREEASPMKHEEVRATIMAYVDGWKHSDREAWGALFADDAVLVDPVGKPAHVGKAAVLAFFDGVQAMPFKFTPHVHRVAVCGHEAMLLFRMEAVGKDGNGMFVEVADIFALNEAGKISSLKAYWDKGCRGVMVANQVAGGGSQAKAG